MGGSSSTNKSEVFQNLVNDAFMKNLQACSLNSSTEQSIVIVGNRNQLSNIEMQQLFSSLLTCVQDVAFMSSFQTNLSNSIKQAAESQSVAVLGALGNSDSNVSTAIHNSVTNTVNIENMTKLVNNVKNSQMIKITGDDNNLSNISLEQITQAIASNSQQMVANISAVAEIKNALDQESKSTQQDPVANFVNAVANLASGPLMIILGIIIAIVIGIVGVSYMFGSNPEQSLNNRFNMV
jgi:type IV secretory pathway VirB2 component (pilin)